MQLPDWVKFILADVALPLLLGAYSALVMLRVQTFGQIIKLAAVEYDITIHRLSFCEPVEKAVLGLSRAQISMTVEGHRDAAERMKAMEKWIVEIVSDLGPKEAAVYLALKPIWGIFHAELNRLQPDRKILSLYSVLDRRVRLPCSDGSVL